MGEVCIRGVDGGTFRTDYTQELASRGVGWLAGME